MRIGRGLDGRGFVLKGFHPGYAPHLHLPNCHHRVQQRVLEDVLEDVMVSGKPIVSLSTDAEARSTLLRLAEAAGRLSDVVEIHGEGGSDPIYHSALKLDKTEVTGCMQFVFAQSRETDAATRTALLAMENYLVWSHCSGHRTWKTEELADLASLDGFEFMARAGAEEAPAYVTTFLRRHLAAINRCGLDFGNGVMTNRAWHDDFARRIGRTTQLISAAMRVTRPGIGMAEVFSNSLICIVRSMPADLATLVAADLDHAVTERFSSGKVRGNVGGVVVLRDTSWVPLRHAPFRFENQCAASGISLVMPTPGDCLPDLFGPTDNRVRILPIARSTPLPFGVFSLSHGEYRYRRNFPFSSVRRPEPVVRKKLLHVSGPTRELKDSDSSLH